MLTPDEVIAPPVEPSCTRQLTALLTVPVTVALNAIEPPAITDVVCGVTETDGFAAGSPERAQATAARAAAIIGRRTFRRIMLRRGLSSRVFD